MTLRIVADVREDGTTIRLIGRMRAEHIAPVREEIGASRAPTALDLDEVTLTDIDAVRFLVAAERDGIVLQHCAPFIREWIARESGSQAREQLVKGACMPTKLSIVFCHGIWADGSSFSKVIPPLQAEGYEVIAAQYGLDTPEGDVATVKRTLGRVGSPAILVGHSYGGSVITAAGTDDRVVGSSTSRRLRTMQARHRRASRRSFRSQTCSSTSKSRTGASGCGRKASCASREIFPHKSNRSSGRPTMRRLPTCSAGMLPASLGSRSRPGTSWPTTTGRFSRICSASWRSGWEPLR